MSKLYSDLAEVYEAMYATFIDYKEEYHFYSNILRTYGKKSVLEIGSGTGNLASYFRQNGFEYCGLDLSEEMIKIAKRKAPDADFIRGDMRNFQLNQSVAGIIITGRTISYLLSNEDVNKTFKSVYDNLENGGIFCFDIIDANRFIPQIIKKELVVHEAVYKNVSYTREGRWRPNFQYGMDVTWESTYFKQVGDKQEEIGKDTEIARAFTKNEMELFLGINGFEILDIIDRKTYAFPTYVFVAEKK